MDSYQKILGLFLLFFMLLVSYAPLSSEVHDIASNSSGNSSVIALHVWGAVDLIYTPIHVFFTIASLISGIYQLIKIMR